MVSITRDIGLVSFTGNPILLGIESFNYLDENDDPRPFYTVFCDIYLEDPALGGDPYATESIQVDANGLGKFDLSTVLKGLTTPTVTWPIVAETKATKDTNAVVQFFIKLSDGFGMPFVKQSAYHTSTVYYAIPGGFSDAILKSIEDGTSNGYAFLSANKIFLTSQPALKRTLANQYELLRYFNFSATNVSAALKLKQYDIDGNSATTTPWSGTLTALSLYTFNVTPTQSLTIAAATVWWEVWLEVSGTLISEVISYKKTEVYPTNPRLFVMQNSLGGFDTVLSTGNRNITSEGETQSGYVAHTGSVRKYLEPIQDRRLTKNIYKGLLGYFTSEEMNWLREFFMSEKKWLVIGSTLETVVLQQNEMPSDTDDPPGAIEIEAVLGSPFMFFF